MYGNFGFPPGMAFAGGNPFFNEAGGQPMPVPGGPGYRGQPFNPYIRSGYGWRGVGRFGRNPQNQGPRPTFGFGNGGQFRGSFGYQGGQRPGGRFPMKANGVPNAMAAGFGQGPRWGR